MLFFVEIDRHDNHGARIITIDFGGHRSKFKVTMDISRNKFVFYDRD